MNDLFKLDYSLINEVCKSRPSADHSIEQYLMTSESLYCHLKGTKEFFTGKKVLYIGDDDHQSILASHFFETQSLVLEIDRRIIENQKRWKTTLSLKNHSIVYFDITKKPLNLNAEKFDGFVMNPPYGSKNEAFGAKVWLSYALKRLKKGGIGLIILPIDFDLPWSISNMIIFQNFLSDNNCMIFKIENDIHTYEDLPDKNLRSSNIWSYYMGGAKNLLTNTNDQRNVYR